MIAAIYIEKFEDLIDEPQTINLGGKYLYTFEKQDDDTIIVTRKLNEQYVEGFFNISGSGCKVDLVTAIVGENGVGKSRLMQTLSSENYRFFIESRSNKYIYILSENSNYEPQLFNNKDIFHLEIIANNTYVIKLYKTELDSIDRNYKVVFYSSHNNYTLDIRDNICISSQNNKSNNSLNEKIYELIWSDLFQKIANNLSIQCYSIGDFKFSIKEYNLSNDISQLDISFKNILYMALVNFLLTYYKDYINYKLEDNMYGEEYFYQLLPKTCPSYEDNIRLLKNLVSQLIKYSDLFNEDNLFYEEKETKLRNIGYKSIPINILKDIFIINNDIKMTVFQLFCKSNIPIKEYLLDKSLLEIIPSYKLSSGEYMMLILYLSLVENRYNNNIILLLDEADLGFHPNWKKKYVKLLLQTIPYLYEDLKYINRKIGHKKTPSIQIIFTTHDPLTLSDMPNNNVVFLRKNEKGKTIVLNNEDKARPRKTFGANITDILSNAFFVEDGLIGDFAKHKIEEVIYWINKEKQLQYMAKNDVDKAKFKEELAHNKKVIALIDEPVIRRKLTEMITDLAPDNKYYNDAIEAQIKYLQSLKK